MLIKILLYSLLSFSSVNAFASGVDLHMHLTIDVALSPFYSGTLNEKAVATDWNSRLKSRIDFESLEKSDLNLIVAVIYLNPLWGDSEKEFDQQMIILNTFCELHPQWKIVKEPLEAQEEIKKGSKVFIISLEGASIFKDKALFDKLMEKYSVRIVTPLHFSDLGRKLGRPAKQKGFFSPIQALVDIFMPFKYEALSPLGEDLFSYLISKKIWIDLSHSSTEVIEHFLKTRPTGYPILMTHTILKKYYGTDRGVDENLLKVLAQENGALGLLPSKEMLVGTPTQETDCSQSNPYLVQWQEVVAQIGLKNTFLGSDLNSPIVGLPPQKDCPVLPEGLRTAADLKTLVSIQDKESVTNFLKEWSLVRP